MKENVNLIECGNHQFAPWHIICRHLMSGQSREWLTLPSNNPELDYDYLCPECMIEHEQGSHDISNLAAVCMHCVKDLRTQFNIPEDPPNEP